MLRTLRMSLPLLALLPLPLAAQETAPAVGLTIELNATKGVEQGCQLSFLIRNGHETDIDSAIYETVLLDTSGQVDRLTLFDFGELPAGRPRVRQFVVPGTGCDGWARFSSMARAAAKRLAASRTFAPRGST